MSPEDEQERIRRLCERIRVHCERRRWYGPDAGLMWRQGDLTAEVGFLFPPATGAQVQSTEIQLAFPLPAVLRAIYTQVANGGFGPGYGLAGVSDRVPSDEGEVDPSTSRTPETQKPNIDPTLAATAVRAEWRLSEQAALTLEQNPGLHLECDILPDRFLTLCHWGCDVYSRLDGWTGRVYGSGATQSSDWQAEGDPPWVFSLKHQATSVEEWFEKWLAGVLRQPFTADFQGWEEREREVERLTRPTYLDYLDEE